MYRLVLWQPPLLSQLVRQLLRQAEGQVAWLSSLVVPDLHFVLVSPSDGPAEQDRLIEQHGLAFVLLRFSIHHEDSRRVRGRNGARCSVGRGDFLERL